MSRKRTFSSSKPKGRSKFGGSSARHSSSGNRNSGGRRGGGGRKMPTFDPSQFINTNPVDVVEEVYKPKHSFGTFGLDKRLERAIASLGIETPSPIQDRVIPEILKGKDVVGLAETGTGKTAAFLIPLIEKTLQDKTRQTLILAPTRELAIQIEDELKKLSRNTRFYSVVCVGGINIRPQIKALHKKNHFIIGTPGRVLDLINRKNFRTDGITTVVLDEADRMLDMGFINDMKKILGATPTNRETLLFSATMSKETDGIVNNFLKNPVTISVKKKDVTNSIAQDVTHFKHEAKFETLLNLLGSPEFGRVLIFGAMKHSVEKLAQQLGGSGVRAESIHGNKGHGQRQRALSRFKEGHAQVLVATDVAARGIHVDDVTHVINYDLPNTFEDYVHRIGRTGRGTKRGKAITFIPA
jgi:superfamily II DNA/RNA helicase